MEVLKKVIKIIEDICTLLTTKSLIGLEKCRGYGYSLLNNEKLIPKIYSKKISDFEEKIKVYSPFTLIVFGLLIIIIFRLLRKILKKTKKVINFFKNIKHNFIKIYLSFPGPKKKLEEAQKEARKEFNKVFRAEKYKAIEFRDNKQEPTKILAKMEQNLNYDSYVVHCGKLTGSVYCDDDKIKYIASEAAKMFIYVNLLHPDIYTYGRFLESQLIKFGLELFNGTEDSCGLTTSGGTNSIMHALYAYRNLGREKGIKKPEVIIPVTAHAAFLKACDIFKIKCIRIPLDKNYQVDLNKVKRNINANTICIVGSCPNFPHCNYDDIEGLSKIAVKYNVPLHVDCCLGGFLVAFHERAGLSLPLFDFRLPGVTSISADLHKYGLCPKGISLLMFAKHKYREQIYFVYPHWTGGLYFTPNFEGSRTAGLIASAYAIMTSLGKDYYTTNAKNLNNAVVKLKTFIKEKCPNLEVIGDPCICGVSFTGPKIEYIYDILGKKGYHLNYLNNPVGIGFIFTSANYTNVDQLIKDIEEANEKVLTEKDIKLGNLTQMYGMSIQLPESVASSNLKVLGDAMLD